MVKCNGGDNLLAGAKGELGSVPRKDFKNTDEGNMIVYSFWLYMMGIQMIM